MQKRPNGALLTMHVVCFFIRLLKVHYFLSLGYYVDKLDGRRYTLAEAAQKGKVYPAGGVPENARDAVSTTSKQQTRTEVTKKQAQMAGGPVPGADLTLQRVIELGHYNPQTGLFIHPETRKEMTLKESIIRGLFNPYDTRIVGADGTEMSLLDAIQADVVDATSGKFNDRRSGRTLSLKEALDAGLILSGAVPLSLQMALSSGKLDANTVEFFEQREKLCK